jgi:hypothetical protein
MATGNSRERAAREQLRTWLILKRLHGRLHPLFRDHRLGELLNILEYARDGEGRARS